MNEGICALQTGQIDTSVETVCRVAVLSTTEPEEAFPLDRIVLPVVVEVHLDVGGADVHLEEGHESAEEEEEVLPCHSPHFGCSGSESAFCCGCTPAMDQGNANTLLFAIQLQLFRCSFFNANCLSVGCPVLTTQHSAVCSTGGLEEERVSRARKG